MLIFRIIMMFIVIFANKHNKTVFSQHNARPARPRPRPKPMFLVSDRSCPKTDGLRPQHWLLLMSVIIRHYCQHAEYWAQHYNNDNNDNAHFNGQTWVGQRQTVKPFWILLMQEMRYLHFSFWSRGSGAITPRRPCGIEYCGCVCVCFMLISMFCSFACIMYEYNMNIIMMSVVLVPAGMNSQDVQNSS